MSTTTPSCSTDVIGQWTEPVEFEVTRERIQANAAATDDSIAPQTTAPSRSRKASPRSGAEGRLR